MKKDFLIGALLAVILTIMAQSIFALSQGPAPVNAGGNSIQANAQDEQRFPRWVWIQLDPTQTNKYTFRLDGNYVVDETGEVTPSRNLLDEIPLRVNNKSKLYIYDLAGNTVCTLSYYYSSDDPNPAASDINYQIDNQNSQSLCHLLSPIIFEPQTSNSDITYYIDLGIGNY